MNKKIIILLTFIGLIGLLSSCEKDETKVVMSSNPIAPTISVLPDLTLIRAHGLDTLVFIGTPVNPGFTSSANYFLEACATGNNFKDSIVLYSGVQDKQIKMTVGDLNGMLLKKLPADQVSSVDFRIRSVLVVDAGTGALGTSTNPMTYTSDILTQNVTIYGLPRLDLIANSVVIGKIESALGNGKYTGFVKLDVTKPFTLKDPDANIIYGGTGTTLAKNGAAITVAANGWYKLSVDVNALSLEKKDYMVGLIGSATPNGWSAPDSKMDYNAQGGYWYITITLTTGEVKFRMNDVWNAGINLGIGDATHPQYDLTNLWNDGGSKNIPVTAGNYTIKLYIGTSTYSCTIKKN